MNDFGDRILKGDEKQMRREGNEEKFKMRTFLSLICYLRVGPGFWGEIWLGGKKEER